MAADPKRIEIAPEDRLVLEKWASALAIERRLADRASDGRATGAQARWWRNVRRLNRSLGARV